jgi:hypothetical protein
MKGKPIEPGCLAMIVGSVQSPKNNGKVVRVIRECEPYLRPPEAEAQAQQKGIRLTKSDGVPERSWWVEPVHGKLRWSSARRLIDVWCAGRSYRQRHLIRLDDDEAPKEVVRTVVKSKPVDEVI